MSIKRYKPEGILTKLRQVEVLGGQGMANTDAIRHISITEQTGRLVITKNLLGQRPCTGSVAI